MKRSDARYMEIALELAAMAAEQGEVPVGAVVVLNGEVVGRGFNKMISTNDPTAHAEIEAIRDAARRVGRWRLDGASLYVTLEPCVMCAGAIMAARLSRVVYGADDPKKGGVVSVYSLLSDPRLGGPVKVARGILAERSRALLRSFFEDRRTL